jgi:hypothetical protein
MPAGRPKSIDNNKVFDIAKPGKSTPLSTSRPVILNHTMSVKDKSVVNVDPITEEEPLSPPSVTRKIIKPMSDQQDDESSEVIVHSNPSGVAVIQDSEPNQPSPTAPEVIKVSPESDTGENNVREVKKKIPIAENAESELVAESPQPTETIEKHEVTTAEVTEDSEITKTEEAADTVPGEKLDDTDSNVGKEEQHTNGSESASVDALAEASEKTKEDKLKEDEQIKRDAALQGLIDSKKYVVPLAHDSSPKKDRSWAWVLILLFVVIIIGAYLAIDAKYIKTSITLPYHFFGQ